jgi:hypothetical protein
MRCSSIIARGFILVLPMFISMHAVAGPYADDMAKCLVKATSTEDRGIFMRWLFAAMSLHPEVASMAAVSPQQRDDLNKRTGALIQTLLTESCRSETLQAVRYEGPATIRYAFQVFGQAAAGDLFSDPRVAAGMKDLAKYVDQEKLKQLSTAGGAK